MKPTAYVAARQLYDQGVSIIPLQVNGSKKPRGEWKQYCRIQCTPADLRKWFQREPPCAIGVITGDISNNLTIVDIDNADRIEAFEKQLRIVFPDVLEKLVVVETGSLRRHYYFFLERSLGKRRIPAYDPPEPGSVKPQVAIEIRANGNYTIGPGSPIETHADHHPYRVISDRRLDEIAMLTWSEFKQLYKICKSLTKHVKEPKPKYNGAEDAPLDISRPGDDFNVNGKWEDILRPLKYRCVLKDPDGVRYWKRPGGKSEWSLTTGLVSKNGRELMHVFSTNCGHFETDENYTKFGAFAAAFHDCDLSLAAADLSRKGYGQDQDIGDESDDGTDDLRAVVTSFADIKFREVQWLWDQRLACGYINNLSGDAGCGKSYIFCSIAAHVSKGLEFPDGSPCPKGSTVIISDEDGYEDSLGPRLKRQGANLRQCHFFDVRDDKGDDVQFDAQKHVALLHGILEEYPNTRLLVFDPISAYLGQADSNSNSDVRRVLGPLGKLAIKHGVAILGINHFRKSEGRAVSRTLGSVGFTAKARVEWQAGIHPDSDHQSDADKLRLFLQGKNNLGSATGLSYQIRGAKNKGVLHWDSEPVHESAQILGRKPQRERPGERAEQLLEACLADGPVPFQPILDAAEKAKISRRTIYQVRKELGIESRTIDGEMHWCYVAEGSE